MTSRAGPDARPRCAPAAHRSAEKQAPRPFKAHFTRPVSGWPKHGVVYAGTGRQRAWAALAITGRNATLVGDRPATTSDWTDLVDEVAAAGDRRVVVSSEFFADGDDETARRVVTELAGARAHVVVTLRPLIRIIVSQWQQYLQNGLRTPYEQ
ncbi:MAG: hypothetical protein GEV07_07885 [Streptosporangiales bacterium]|nr:hypothetical protein [Streptosporangiales bacterium]